MAVIFTLDLQAKFEMFNFVHSKYMSGPHDVEMGYVTLTRAPFGDDLSLAGWDFLRPTYVPNMKFLTVPITKTRTAVQIVENRVVRGHSR